MKIISQSVTLLLASTFVLIIITTPLTGYMVPILGLIIAFSVIFIMVSKRKKTGEELFSGSNKEVFTVTVALLLAIFLTGGLSSGIFFLLYFLLFGIVFLFEPATVFVLLLGLGIVFFQSISEGDLVSNLIRFASLAFLSPVSYFFGREFQRKEKLSSEIEDKTGQILEDAQTLKNRTNNEDAIREIENIEQKAEELRREAEKE